MATVRLAGTFCAPMSNRPLPHITSEDYHRVVKENEFAMHQGSYDWDTIEAELIALNDKLANAVDVK